MANYLVARLHTDRYFGDDIPELQRGDTLFLADVRDSRGHARWSEVSFVPFRKNQSHEECEIGWCGSTSGVDVTATGRCTVTSVLGERETKTGEKYVLVRVRTNRDAPLSFELADDDMGGQFPVRITAEES